MGIFDGALKQLTGSGGGRLSQVNEKTSPGLQNLINRSTQEIDAPRKSALLADKFIGDTADRQFSDIASRGQGSLQNSITQAQLQGAGGQSFFNRLSTLNNLNTSQQQGDAARGSIDARSRNIISDISGQEGFRDQATLNAAGLQQGIFSRNAQGLRDVNAKNLAADQLNTGGIIGSAISKVGGNLVTGGLGGLVKLGSGLFS